MERLAEMVVAAFGRGVAAIITTAFGFVWIGWGLLTLGNLSLAIWGADILLLTTLMTHLP